MTYDETPPTICTLARRCVHGDVCHSRMLHDDAELSPDCYRQAEEVGVDKRPGIQDQGWLF